MLIKHIELENIKSYKHFKVDFRRGTTAINGENGAGKTTLVEAIGFALFDQLARPLLQAYHYDAAFARFQATYAEWGLWVILIKGVTPIPYKIVTIASGAAR